MRENVGELIGLAAGILTTASFVPQVLQSLRTLDLSGISLRMYSLFVAGVALWAVYGFVLGSWPVLITNIITFALAGVILLLKLREK
jgi:MtN3 and saliva related transmembrane protein